MTLKPHFIHLLLTNLYSYFHRYPHPIASDLNTNPEFPTTTTQQRQTSVVAAQLFTLRNSISQLRNAYNGHDVEWTDTGKYQTDLLILATRQFNAITMLLF